MSDHTLDVFLEDFGKLAGSIFSFGQPFRILPMPDQGVPANLHIVPYSEIHNLIVLGKVEALRLRMNHLPLKSVFRFHHVELARERGCVCRLGKLRRPYRSADERSTTLRRLAQRLLSAASAQSQATGGGHDKDMRSPFHVVPPASSSR